ncbi:MULTISPECIES: hypothetical protein [unclassified Pseudoalteromonas]|uniref:hypothetical protein n=1 Tax=unclassified Pseudoalteromonas TaxID=194690 RepID=UPI002096A05E|nr:hypothetical protein [Pseudoalteromonas sp. XMcav2-N]MCO7188685.1 hypothetical protein [Pseudoalteromonas sp. XMcav2-N]
MNKLIIGLLCATGLYAAPQTQAQQSEHDKQIIAKRTVKGHLTTGVNNYCGRKLFEFPAAYDSLNDLSFQFVGEYDPTPGALDAKPLSAENCEADTILASTTDPVNVAWLQSFLDMPDADPRLKNRPIMDKPTYVDLIGNHGYIERRLPEHSNPVPFFDGPKEEITLGSWSKARGRYKFQCYNDNSAKTVARFKHLFPNSMYSMLAVWDRAGELVVQPFGGLPNVFITDKRGNARYEKEINGCPLLPTEDGSSLLYLIISYHPNASITGASSFITAAPATVIDKDGSVFESTQPPGIVIHDQIMFPINGLEKIQYDQPLIAK